jgi:hypothetical protein
VDPDYAATIGLGRAQARALVAAAGADAGSQALRSAAIIRLLLHNARGPVSLRRRRGRPRGRCRPPCAAGDA